MDEPQKIMATALRAPLCSRLIPSLKSYSLSSASPQALHFNLLSKPLSLSSPHASSKLRKRASLTLVFSLQKLSETQAFPVSGEEGEFLGKFPSDSGVYAVFDKDSHLQFIGISRSIAASVAAHKKALPELCFSVKFGVVDDPDRAALTNAWKSWMEERISSVGKVPPGNESGNTTWVRRPRQKPDLRLTPGRHVQLTVPLEELIDQLVKENEVVVFIKGSRSSPLCGFSQRVVGILNEAGVDYESVDVLDEEYNSGLRETLKMYSNWPTFPQVFVKGELVGGADILSSMADNGSLAQLFRR
ncbi:bifunctional monothiol glutaredoxin-S16, chloroplastic [Amborella trichopoda]|uniref:Glutaredoxin domain-containing protein n=1 Tax=Amborella trichopoda TaxID=13333 RepID=W1P5Z7_AMBTC|nr:bifunctional monothiol glutaredoxin-S16, chloroplastic [Amborella trichopoda]ERN05282.1 hypothetical protein AMTR_s00007p00141970 [Amborella trichopoda]|eukprot:XP_006843607.3 bifunctional monothiol glutaredoxin-S16, chloroplastic [Amborella trichopoda]